MDFLKKVQKSNWLVGCVFFVPVVACAGNVNIDQLMQSNADFAVQKSIDSCIAKIPPKKNSSLSEMQRYLKAVVVCKVVNGKVPSILSNITVTTAGTNYQNLVISDVPSSIVNIAPLSVPNCTNTPITFSQTREVSVSENASVVKKDTISTEKSVTFNGSAEINLAVVKFGGSSSISGKQIITNENGSTLQYDNIRKETINLQTVIQPYTVTNIDVIASKNLASVNYTGDLTLDANVNADFNPFQMYSMLVPDNKLFFSGSIYSNFVDKTTIRYTQAPLDPLTCAPSPAVLQKSTVNTVSGLSKVAVPQEGSLVDLSKNYIPYGYNYSTPKQVTKLIGSGLQIATANVIGSVQVRAKTLQTEPCGITFFANDKKQLTMLIPNAWSEWITLDTFVGASHPFVSAQDQCAGNVQSEVRYFE